MVENYWKSKNKGLEQGREEAEKEARQEKLENIRNLKKLKTGGNYAKPGILTA
jgi:hypothetical protein